MLHLLRLVVVRRVVLVGLDLGDVWVSWGGRLGGLEVGLGEDVLGVVDLGDVLQSMYMYMCIYVYLHTYISLTMYMHIFTYTYTHMSIYMYIYIYIYICICMYVCIYIYRERDYHNITS